MRHKFGGVLDVAATIEKPAIWSRKAVLGLAGMMAAALLTACGPSQESAESPADFYAGNTVSILVGYPAGGGYDQAARIVARHMGKYIPGNPQIIVRNQPGAGSLTAANQLYNVAPSDGTYIGLFADMNLIAPLLGVNGAQFDARKVKYIGALGRRETAVLVVRSDSPATTLEGAKRNTVLLGTTGPDGTAVYPAMLNDLLGTKFKVIPGYASGPEILLAMQRGEVHGRSGGMSYKSLRSDHPAWLASGEITIMAQLGLRSTPELKGVPLIIDEAETAEDRKVMEMCFGPTEFAHTFSAPEGVPEARLKVLQEAFKKTLSDPEFLKEAQRVLIEEVSYIAPEKIMAFLDDAYAQPPSVVERVKSYVAQ